MTDVVVPVPRVVDVYHGDIFYSEIPAHTTATLATDAVALKNAGIWGVIHKATQGLGVNDARYAGRTKAFRSAQMLTGAYHFNTGDSIQGQVNHFFDAAQPDGQTMMALDFEDNRASQMTLSQAVQFLQLADEKLGRSVWLYSGNRIKELICDASDEVRQVFAARPLWLCEYGPVQKLVDANGKLLPWKVASIWQFTGDGIGPQPHSLPGVVTKGIDINHFGGTRDELAAIWPGIVPPAVMV